MHHFKQNSDYKSISKLNVTTKFPAQAPFWISIFSNRSTFCGDAIWACNLAYQLQSCTGYPLTLEDIEEAIPRQSSAYSAQRRLYLAPACVNPWKCDRPPINLSGSRIIRGKAVKFLWVVSFNTKVAEKPTLLLSEINYSNLHYTRLKNKDLKVCHKPSQQGHTTAIPSINLKNP